MRRRISSNKPMKDDWDLEFLEYVRKEAPNILKEKKNINNIAFQRYYERYSKLECDKKNNGGKKKYLGMIANAIDEDDLKYLVERKINNRSSIELTDLHELYLCTGTHPDTLFNIHEPETIAQLNYLSYQDIRKLSERIRNMPEKVPFVVQCVPLLGLYLTVQVDSKNQPNRLTYQIVDSFGIFSWPNDSPTSNKHIFAIPDPPMGGGNDGKMERTIESVFYNALVVFDIHCSLAKGIFTDRNNQPMDRYKALPKKRTVENLDIRKIAIFLSLDSEHEMSNSNGFATDSRMLENTVKLFMTDVVNMQEAQLEREREKEKQRAEIKGKGAKENNDVDLIIAKAEGKRSMKTMKRYE